MRVTPTSSLRTSSFHGPSGHAIEDAAQAHADAMAEIHQAAFPAREAWSCDVIRLQLELPASFGLIAPLGGMILGRVMAGESEIITLAVIPSARRLGLGAALLRAAMDRAFRSGATEMFLEVAVTNRAAQMLYAGHGFQRAGLRRRYYTDGTDALVLRAVSPPGGTGHPNEAVTARVPPVISTALIADPSPGRAGR